MHNNHKFFSFSKRHTKRTIQPERGIRQGGLISSYIFIICVEYLGRYFIFMTNTPKTGSDIKVSENDPTIPYLMFSNDCLLFCKGNRKAARHIVLDNYCKVSGQLVNFHKSLVQF